MIYGQQQADREIRDRIAALEARCEELEQERDTMRATWLSPETGRGVLAELPHRDALIAKAEAESALLREALRGVRAFMVDDQLQSARALADRALYSAPLAEAAARVIAAAKEWRGGRGYHVSNERALGAAVDALLAAEAQK